MRLIRARAAIAATGVAVGLLATACSGGAASTSSEAGGESGGASISGSVATGSAAGSPAATDRPSSGAPGGGFCDVVRSEHARLKPLVPPHGVAPTAAQLRAFIPAAANAEKRTAEAAPPDIKADADRSAQKAAAFATRVERANYDLSRLPANAGTDDDDGSVSRVDAYVKRACGFDRTTG